MSDVKKTSDGIPKPLEGKLRLSPILTAMCVLICVLFAGCLGEEKPSEKHPEPPSFSKKENTPKEEGKLAKSFNKKEKTPKTAAGDMDGEEKLADNETLKQGKNSPEREQKTGEKKMSEAKKQWDSPPEMFVDTAKIYVAEIQTGKGTIKLELYPQHAPKTVNNFVFLTNEGFYDGVSFHRVIANFVIQGGDPSGTGAGGPGYRFEDETAGSPLLHETGVISMANSGPNTNGSQFFITHSPQPHLNGRHTVFGKVVEGMDVVSAVRQGDVMEKVVAGQK